MRMNVRLKEKIKAAVFLAENRDSVIRCVECGNISLRCQEFVADASHSELRIFCDVCGYQDFMLMASDAGS